MNVNLSPAELELVADLVGRKIEELAAVEDSLRARRELLVPFFDDDLPTEGEETALLMGVIYRSIAAKLTVALDVPWALA